MTTKFLIPGLAEIEAGSPGEACSLIEEKLSDWNRYADLVAQLTKRSFDSATLVPPGATQDAPADTEASDVAEPGKKRGRRSKAQIAADEAAAAAALAASGPTPPPLPAIPTMEALPNPSVAVTLPGPPPAAPAPAPIPAATGTDGLELPGFLDRRGQPEPTPTVAPVDTAAPAPLAIVTNGPAPVPAPPLPVAPPALAPAPSPAMPALILGPKVADKLLASKSGLTDGGAAWLNWLCQVGVIPNAEKTTFDEAIAVIRLTVDAAIKPVADHLGVL